MKKIADRCAAIQAAIARGNNAVDQDFAFHCEIADATSNPQFRRFLEYLSPFIIPRRTVWGRSAPPTKREQLDLFQHEHAQILAAIRDHAVTEERDAMQRHLINSRARYKALAAELGFK